MMQYRIVYVFGHFEALSAAGKFLCSGDTANECAELAEMLIEERRRETLYKSA